MVGSDVQLGCSYAEEKTFDLNELFVYWQIGETEKPETVTYYLSGNSSAGHDNNQYKDRAQLSLDSMKQGDFSLRLFNITPQDEQKFNCLVFSKLEKILDVVVTLHVAGKGVNADRGRHPRVRPGASVNEARLLAPAPASSWEENPSPHGQPLVSYA